MVINVVPSIVECFLDGNPRWNCDSVLVPKSPMHQRHFSSWRGCLGIPATPSELWIAWMKTGGPINFTGQTVGLR